MVQFRIAKTPVVLQKRAQLAQLLLQRLKVEDCEKFQICSDEKIFTADVPFNCCNSRYLSRLPVYNVDPEVYTKLT